MSGSSSVFRCVVLTTLINHVLLGKVKKRRSCSDSIRSEITQSNFIRAQALRCSSRTAVRNASQVTKSRCASVVCKLQMKSPRHNLRAPPTVNSANGCVRPPRPRVHRFASIPPDPAPTTNQVPLERDSRKEALLADFPLSFVSRCQPSEKSVRSKSLAFRLGSLAGCGLALKKRSSLGFLFVNICNRIPNKHLSFKLGPI